MVREVFCLKINKKLLIICLVIPLAAGGIAAPLPSGGIDTFEIPAGMAVSASLDDSVYSDGHCILSGPDIR